MKTIYKHGQLLRCGYTTGSCASSATVAAAKLLLTGEIASEVEFLLANGSVGRMEVKACYLEDDRAVVEVVKDGGDDPDVTTGMIIGARVKLLEKGIELISGEGIGIVKVQGLRVEEGQGAINPRPREALIKNLEHLSRELGYKGGFQVEVFAPEGEAIAKKTYNSRLGIQGGISILGTTGIVEPMSEAALVETIKLDMDRWYQADSQRLIIAPGNYGKTYCEKVLGFQLDQVVKVSNYLGEALDYAKFKGFKQVLFVGHMGKLVKVAGGIMNTHSSYGDCRMEIIAAYTALLGGGQRLIEDILSCTTTHGACDLLEEAQLLDKVMSHIIKRIIYHIKYRLGEGVKVDVVVFGNNEATGFSSLDMEGV